MIFVKICYNEQLCGGFYSNRTLISFNNTTCRCHQDFPFESVYDYQGVTSLRQCLRSIQYSLHQCNTILQHDSEFCDNSTMYQCMNSSKYIVQIHLFDVKNVIVTTEMMKYGIRTIVFVQ
jgi:hypothetical protein